MKPDGDSEYRADIDGLRAIAVLSVIGFHAFPRVMKGGFIGVDIFFVISGFLISGLILKSLGEGRFSYLDFYARRIRRIFTALAVVLAACLIYGLFFLLPNQYADLGRQVAAGAGFAANIYFSHERGYFFEAERFRPLLHLWSLGVEEQFYIAWPLLLAFFYRRSLPIAGLIGFVLLGSFAWNVAWVHTQPGLTFYLPMTRFWELLLGAMLAYAAVTAENNLARELLASPAASAGRSARIRSEACAGIGILLLAAGLLLINDAKPFPGWWALLPTLGTVLLIAGRHSRFNRRILAHPAMVFVGLISYPLYLWHWVLLAAAPHPAGHLQFTAVRCGVVALSFLAAWLTYELLEKPVRFGAHRARMVPILSGAMGLIGLAGVSVAVTHGAGYRLPPQLRPLASFDYDHETAYRVNACLFATDRPLSKLAAECIDPPEAGAPLLLLWGDSHAASLYPGLRAMQRRDHDFRIAQMTAGSCPPLLGVQIGPRKKYCAGFNDAVIARVETLRPDIVLITGFWSRYADSPKSGAAELTGLQATVRKLTSMGVKRIVVVGEFPLWEEDQPNIALRIWRSSGIIESRTKEYLDPVSIRMDDTIREAILGTDAVYVSPIKLLCNPDGCLISTRPDTAVPLMFDRHHFTDAGSALLIDLAQEKIFPAMTPSTR